ncbi:MAG: hypothetical protein ABJN34_11315 [Litoreibacter sp.]|uniref:hypothetical protein n=1 Tax=Litoreibacter sp. TaxID=1969459 RepID=UPI003298F269
MTFDTAIKAFGILSISALVACGGGDGSNPVTGGDEVTAADPTDPTDPADPAETVNGLPAELANNLNAVNYDPANETLTLELTGFDAPGEPAVYVRDSSIDSAVAGYQAYTRQDDPTDRFFLAIGGTSAGGEVSAIAISDGGQFNRFFGGGFYEQDGTFAGRESGLVSYAGNYAATTNLNALGTNLATPPASTPAEILPREPATIEGRIFLNVSFQENSINGQIIEREFTEYPAITLEDIRLVEGVIADDGTYLGSTEIDVNSSNGAFGGTFGGEGGTAIAGVTNLTDYTDDIENEEEFGVFVLERCGTAASTSDLCDGVNP